jgi:hypothetical protein
VGGSHPEKKTTLACALCLLAAFYLRLLASFNFYFLFFWEIL